MSITMKHVLRSLKSVSSLALSGALHRQLILLLTFTFVFCMDGHAQKGGGGGGGKGGGKGRSEPVGPLLPEDFQNLNVEERMLLAELSVRAAAWITGGSFQNQSPQQVAPFFGHDSDLQEEDSQRGGKENKNEDRDPPAKKNDPLATLRDSIEVTPGLLLATVLTQTQKDLLARGLDERAKRLPDYSSKHGEITSMLSAVRGQGAAAGAAWNLQKLRTAGAEVGRAEVNVALVEARVMTALLGSLEPAQNAIWRKLQRSGLERLDEPELKKLSVARQGLTEEAIVLLERAAVWSDKDRRELVSSPLSFIGDYFGDLSDMQQQKQRGGGKNQREDAEKRMGVVGAFLNMLDRDQRHLMLDLVKAYARLVSDYQGRHAQIASAMLSIRHGAKVDMPALGSSAGELGALEVQIASEQAAVFLKLAASMAPQRRDELASAGEEAVRQSQKKR